MKKVSISSNRIGREKLPTLRHVIEVLAEITIYEAKVVDGVGAKDLSNARRSRP